MIAGILLAAGAGRRFGGNKLIAPLGGRPVVRWSADALAPAVDALFVVVPDADRELRDALVGLPVRWVTNRRSEDGMASSLRCGIEALPADVDAAVVALADQPLVDDVVAPRLVARWRTGGASAVAAEYDDGRGHPVLFGATLFPRLLVLTGDRGAREILDALGTELALVTVSGDRPGDVDTPELLEAARRRLGVVEKR